MNELENGIKAFRQVVMDNCRNPGFAYREWFVSDHLLIVEKIAKDWGRKIVLPEAREAFRTRYQNAQEIIGQYPEKFL